MNYIITPLKAFEDNYIWVIYNQEQAVAIDPGESEALIQFLTQTKLTLSSILITHRHSDHIAGVDKLLNLYPKLKLWNLTDNLVDIDKILINDFAIFEVIKIPGHTMEHVGYLFDNKHLFCGDALFSLGCGRVFTNDYALMFASLNKIKQLNPEVLCYPAHEYTARNLKFTLELDNENTRFYTGFIQSLNAKLHNTGVSLPVYLKDELKYNLFLRDNDPRLWKVLESKCKNKITSAFEYFTCLRQLRNNF